MDQQSRLTLAAEVRLQLIGSDRGDSVPEAGARLPALPVHLGGSRETCGRFCLRPVSGGHRRRWIVRARGCRTRRYCTRQALETYQKQTVHNPLLEAIPKGGEEEGLPSGPPKE